jgi:tRNA(fMet)-specific endonuclease VapC
MYLLDTNVCIRLMSGNPAIQQRVTIIKGTTINISVIVAGELLYGAYKSSRVTENLNTIYTLFDAVNEIHIVDTETMNIYGMLKAELVERFGPNDKTKLRNFRIESIGFMDNDLWIASIAIQHNLILVSADTDIMRLNGIEGLKIENW